MTKRQIVWHFVRAVLVGYLVGIYAYHILIDELVPIDVLIRWPYIEAGFVLSGFIGGAVLGLSPDRLRKGGLWVGGFFAFTIIAIESYVMVTFWMHHELLHKLWGKVLSEWFWRSAAMLLCCALAGYCGQLWVGKWRRKRIEKKPLMAS